MGFKRPGVQIAPLGLKKYRNLNGFGIFYNFLTTFYILEYRGIFSCCNQSCTKFLLTIAIQDGIISLPRSDKCQGQRSEHSAHIECSLADSFQNTKCPIGCVQSYRVFCFIIYYLLFSLDHRG